MKKFVTIFVPSLVVSFVFVLFSDPVSLPEFSIGKSDMFFIAGAFSLISSVIFFLIFSTIVKVPFPTTLLVIVSGIYQILNIVISFLLSNWFVETYGVLAVALQVLVLSILVSLLMKVFPKKEK